MTPAILSLLIRYERDIVLARQRAREIAAAVGFETQDQIRIATALSEIARNAFNYARGGRVEFRVEGTTSPQVLLIAVSDEGPGIADVRSILEGRYRSETGMGLGIAGARRLMDQFEIDSSPGAGTTVVLKKLLPRGRLVGTADLARIALELTRQQPQDPLQEVQQQNQELLRALDELTRRQDELAAVNRELEDTNRGVMALYAELDEKADHLRRADEIKTRFISNMSHEFRTPVNSIQGLARLLLERTDGELTTEQERQVQFVRRAADSLSELVNDLLDLAKVESGKTVVHAGDFEVANLFGALRGMLRPLLTDDSVNLVFDAPGSIPALHTDEAKVAQILRNFVSNALKFTEQGEVRVGARYHAENGTITFSVADTGIGIAPDDQERIFQEFTQIDSPVQRRVKGTGLGLPLCRKLAELLGGTVAVESLPSVGSKFTASIPVRYEAARGTLEEEWREDPSRTGVLVVEDSAESILSYEKILAPAGFQVFPARTLREARAVLAALRPKAILLGATLRDEDTWTFLVEAKQRDDLRGIPVAMVSAVDDRRKAIALGADAYFVEPLERYDLLHALARLTAPEEARRILVVDDEEISRYLLRQHLMTPTHTISEAPSGVDAIRIARHDRPDLICLDLMMPEKDGVEVLRELRADAATRDIPVLVVTSRQLDEDERRYVLGMADGILSKQASRESTLAAAESAMRAARPGAAR